MSPTLAERVLGRDPRAIARAISSIENEEPAAAALVRDIFPHTGRAYLVGITGPPGAGKSTLVDRLTSQFRLQQQEPARSSASDDPGAAEAAHHATETAAAHHTTATAAAHHTSAAETRHHTRVGIIAVDPTSPFSGGAVLGDRLRMGTHAADSGVFIRSMATRGHLGGLSRATGDAALVLDAAGFDIVIIETVGVGQDEVDIIRTADVSVVTLVPGTGDDVQALKAGIMEIADVFVVNKADREGADRLASAVEATLSLHPYGPGEWRPPIIRTIATTGHGIAELESAILAYRAHATSAHVGRRRSRSAYRLRELVSQRFMSLLERDILSAGEFESIVDRIAAREIDPYSAADDLLRRAVAR